MASDIYRLKDEQVAEALSLLAASGGTARTAESWRQDRMTALALGGHAPGTGRRLDAVMPISRREIGVCPGRTLSAGWLSSNQFAARMSLRRQTRDTFPEWAELLPELDAIVVVRRDEGSLAARWYAHCGFKDVLSIRCLYLDMTAPPESHGRSQAGSPNTSRYAVQVIGSADAGTWGDEMSAVYEDVYGACGGTVLRNKNFWSPALTHHYYREHYQFQIVGLWSGAGTSATLMGYAVIGWSGWHSKRPRMDILELATRQWDTAVASELLRTTCQLAWSKGVHQVRAVISTHDPYRGHLARSGFADRWGYLMLAKWLHPQRYLDRLAKNLPREIGEMGLHITAPGEVPLTFKTAGFKGAMVQLQGDQRSIARLLLQRLDVGAALHGGAQETLFSPDGTLSPPEETRIAMAFAWTPWVFHMLDFI